MKRTNILTHLTVMMNVNKSKHQSTWVSCTQSSPAILPNYAVTIVSSKTRVREQWKCEGHHKYSSYTTEIGYGLDDRDSIPGRSRKFPLRHHHIQVGSGARPHLSIKDTRVSFQDTRRSEWDEVKFVDLYLTTPSWLSDYPQGQLYAPATESVETQLHGNYVRRYENSSVKKVAGYGLGDKRSSLCATGNFTLRHHAQTGYEARPANAHRGPLRVGKRWGRASV
jgi:hypothetical protein